MDVDYEKPGYIHRAYKTLRGKLERPNQMFL